MNSRVLRAESPQEKDSSKSSDCRAGCESLDLDAAIGQNTEFPERPMGAKGLLSLECAKLLGQG
jgi:hypothetical protein